jgi:hypothetical protein
MLSNMVNAIESVIHDVVCCSTEYGIFIASYGAMKAVSGEISPTFSLVKPLRCRSAICCAYA